MLIKFWSSDDFCSKRIWTPEEQRAEDTFIDTHQRDKNGRFIPRRIDALPLGNSRTAAKALFHSIERKLVNNPELDEKYRAVFQDYRDKRHLVLASERPVSDKNCYYLQHHAINTNPEQRR